LSLPLHNSGIHGIGLEENAGFTLAKIGIKDKRTIDAINKIYNYRYPFAASLLAYAIIERILKEYIIKHRKNRSLVDYSYCKCSHSGQLSLKKCYKYKKIEFIRNFIKRITLGDAERIVIKNKNKIYSKGRNDLMHSNSYLLEEKKLTETERRDINDQNYKKAIGHLKFVVNNFSDFKVKINKSGISVSK
jgi:hypothetical protein